MTKQKENGKNLKEVDKMIEVGNTGLYFDDGHKGNLKIYMESNQVFRNDYENYIRLDGVNADSSCEVFKAILENADWRIDGERFLNNHEWLIKECLKEQNEHKQRIVQCWKCGLHPQLDNVYIDEEEGLEYCSCPPMCIDADWDKKYVREIPECDHYVLSSTSPPIFLKDFDLRSEYVYGLHVICKIKSIKNPIVKKGRYYQECNFYDDDTSKVLEGLLLDSVADYDKWKRGDKVELFGVFKDGYVSVSGMELIEENTEEPTFINRNSETPGYNEWRKSIISRDGKCVCCGHDKHLEAHHLFGYKENPSLAIDENNGVALCKFCHDKYHNIYGVKNINPIDFMDFIKRFGVR